MINLWCTGSSVDQMSKSNIDSAFKEGINIAINYALIDKMPDFRVFLDEKVADYFNGKLGKSIPVTSSYAANVHPYLKDVAIIPDRDSARARGYTMLYAVDFILERFPDEVVNVYGCDFAEDKSSLEPEGRYFKEGQANQFVDVPYGLGMLANRHDFSKWNNMSPISTITTFTRI